MFRSKQLDTSLLGSLLVAALAGRHWQVSFDAFGQAVNAPLRERTGGKLHKLDVPNLGDLDTV
jgi:hypothetical protein